MWSNITCVVACLALDMASKHADGDLGNPPSLQDVDRLEGLTQCSRPRMFSPKSPVRVLKLMRNPSMKCDCHLTDLDSCTRYGTGFFFS